MPRYALPVKDVDLGDVRGAAVMTDVPGDLF